MKWKTPCFICTTEILQNVIFSFWWTFVRCLWAAPAHYLSINLWLHMYLSASSHKSSFRWDRSRVGDTYLGFSIDVWMSSNTEWNELKAYVYHERDTTLFDVCWSSCPFLSISTWPIFFKWRHAKSLKLYYPLACSSDTFCIFMNYCLCLPADRTIHANR